MRLQRWGDVSQQHKIALAIRTRQCWLEMLENIQRHRAGLTRIQVPRIFARPAESLSFDLLHPFRINFALFPKIELGRWKITSDNTDESYWRKETRAERCVGGGSA